MLQFIVEFFQRLIDYIFNIIDFGVLFCKSLFNIVNMLFSMFNSIPTFFSWLPDTLHAYILIAFTVALVFKVVGREG